MNPSDPPPQRPDARADGDGVSSMHPASPDAANYDWLLAWSDWTAREDRRLEAVFGLEAFLQRSRTTQDAWSLEFLSWKCERLASDGCWYEARVEHRHDGADVRVLLDR